MYYLCNIIKELLIMFFSINIVASSIVSLYKIIDTVEEPVNKIALYIVFGAIILFILYLSYTTSINYLYRFKLQGIIFPGVMIGGGIGLSILYNKLNSIFSNVNIKDTSTFYTVKRVFTIYDNIIDFYT